MATEREQEARRDALADSLVRELGVTAGTSTYDRILADLDARGLCGAPYNGVDRKEHEPRRCGLPPGHDGKHGSGVKQRLFVNAERTTLVTLWERDGEAEAQVAQRPNTEAVWGPPIHCTPDQTTSGAG